MSRRGRKAQPAPARTTLTRDSNFTGKPPTYDTGRNVDAIVSGFFDRINDSNPAVTSGIQSSVQRIGVHEPLLILSKGLKKLVGLRNKPHKVLIMDELRSVCESDSLTKHVRTLPEDLCLMLVQFTIKELVSEKGISSAWQNSAALLLISLSRFNPQVVAEELLSHFVTNKLPHYFIIKAFSDFSKNFPRLFFPWIKECLSRTLPLFTSIRSPHLKWVVCAALGRFAENVLIVIEDGQTQVNLAEYSGSFSTGIRHLLNHWIRDRENRVRLAAAEAVGYMSHLIENEDLIGLVPKIFTVLPLQLRKAVGPSKQFPIANGIQLSIDVVMRVAPESLIEFVDGLMATLLHMVIENTKVYSSGRASEEIRERCKLNEEALLGALQLLGQKTHYTQNLTTLLSRKYDARDTWSRVGSLRVLTHIIRTLPAELDVAKETIVTSINIMTQKPELHVHLQLAKVVEAMGKGGFLLVHGGADVVHRLVETAAIPDAFCEAFEARLKTAARGKEVALPEVNPVAVRDEADRVLRAIVERDNAENVDGVLYPYLLECFMQAECTGAFAMLCYCMSTVAKRKKQDDDFIIDFQVNVNLPLAHEILARFFVMLCRPFGRNSSGLNILRAMYCLSPNIHDNLVEVWSRKLPEMKKFLDTHTAETYEQEQWSTLVLNLVRDSLNAVEDDEWNVQLGEAMAKQSALYSNDPELKKNLLSIYGLIIQKTRYRDFVHKAIDGLVKMSDHNKVDERVGCARGLGQAATTHTDVVLHRLQEVMRAKEFSRGLFGGKPKPGDITAFTKATCLLAYGYVCMLTPIGLINSRVEVHVVQNILPVLTKHPSPIIKELGLRSLDLVAKAVHPSRLEGFVLRSRDDVIRAMLAVIRPNAKKAAQLEFVSKLKILGLEGMTRMIHLPPVMKPEVHAEVITSLCAMFTVNYGEFDEGIVEKIHAVLLAVMQAQVDEHNLDLVLAELEKCVKSPDPAVRIKGTNAYIFILKEFVALVKTKKRAAEVAGDQEKKKKRKRRRRRRGRRRRRRRREGEEEGESSEEEEEEEEEEGESSEDEEEDDTEQLRKQTRGRTRLSSRAEAAKAASPTAALSTPVVVEVPEENKGFVHFGRMLAAFVPRLTESDIKVRENAFTCFYLALRIQHFLVTGSTGLPDYIAQFKSIQAYLQSTETREIKKIIVVTSAVLAKAVDKETLVLFMEHLMNTLTDVEIDGARGSCVVINGMIRHRGEELQPIVDKLMLALIEKMQMLKGQEKMVKGLLYCVREISNHHLLPVIRSILTQPVPHVQEVKDSLQIVAADRKLNAKTFAFLVDLMNNGQIFEETVRRVNERERIVIYHNTPQALAVIHSMAEILEVEELAKFVGEHYAEFLPTCVLRIASCHDVAKGTAAPVAVQVLENFLRLVGDDEVLYEINRRDIFALLRAKDTFPDGILKLMESVVDEHAVLIPKFFKFVQPFNTRPYFGHCLGACGMISVMLHRVRNDRQLVQTAINELLRKTGMTENSTIKAYALRGLSNIVHHPPEILHTYVSPIANALMTCIEDPDPFIILEAMNSLKTVFTVAEDQYVSGLLINLCIRLKPSFEKPDPSIRSSSILLFGALERFCQGSIGQLLLGNVHTFLPILFTRLLDDEEIVRAAALESLRQLVPQLGSDALVDVFARYDDFDSFDAFAEDYSRVFVQDFPRYVPDFVRNTSPFLRYKIDGLVKAAVLVTGFIFKYIDERLKGHVNLRHVINGLLELMRHPKPEIREKVALVLGNLHEC